MKTFDHKGNVLSAEKWMGKEVDTLWSAKVVLTGETQRLQQESEGWSKEKFSKELSHYDRNIGEWESLTILTTLKYGSQS